MINWRSIDKEGTPTDSNKSYLVTDGKEISTTNISLIKNYNAGEIKKIKFNGWTGDENTYEENECCSGTPIFDLIPTHWCPTDEINLPNHIDDKSIEQSTKEKRCVSCKWYNIHKKHNIKCVDCINYSNHECNVKNK